ncbi:class E sortase [Salinactinospora qingdaonensis]|uniref:Class E sortase n=1 Tax=Salinactinospora qingdaonensis TaxID=702744 RepID=A0ABP7FPN1_9ACTN
MISTTERRSHRARGRGGRRRKSAPGRRRRVDPAGPPARLTAGDVVRTTVRFIGELLFTAGLIMLFFAAYQIYGKQAQTNAEQEQLDTALEQQWQQQEQQQQQAAGPDSEPLPGTANSRMYIPDLDQQWVVVNGVSQADIKYGPGHYPDTAMPGEVGNYSVAGHRVPAVFWDLDQLDNGDDIVLEDGEAFYTYEVIATEVVTPDQVEVVAPDPFSPEADPTRRLLTLTTCHPKLQNAHRLVVHAELTDDTPKDQGMPANIADMAPESEQE